MNFKHYTQHFSQDDTPLGDLSRDTAQDQWFPNTDDPNNFKTI